MKKNILDLIGGALNDKNIGDDYFSDSPHIFKTIRMSTPLAAWMKIIAERTGLSHTDIIEYALQAAATPGADLHFFELAMLHKAKNVRQGKRWSPKRVKSLIREDLDVCESIYGVTKENAIERWKRALRSISLGKTKSGQSKRLLIG